jgi:ubiquinone/menaquinone biosynthesis C-methylase UbiE
MDSVESIHQMTRQAYNDAADKYHSLFYNEMNEKEYDRNLLDSFSDLLEPGAAVCDAGCGPSGHIGKYMLDKGLKITGVDISDRCVELASEHAPEISFIREDMLHMSFPDESFDGIISYYSIIHTPRKDVGRIFAEFNRILKPRGYLLIAVKEGNEEGIINDFMGVEADIYFSYFNDSEIKKYCSNYGFDLLFLETRNPYDFEINNRRIFAIGRKCC